MYTVFFPHNPQQRMNSYLESVRDNTAHSIKHLNQGFPRITFWQFLPPKPCSGPSEVRVLSNAYKINLKLYLFIYGLVF